MMRYLLVLACLVLLLGADVGIGTSIGTPSAHAAHTARKKVCYKTVRDSHHHKKKVKVKCRSTKAPLPAAPTATPTPMQVGAGAVLTIAMAEGYVLPKNALGCGKDDLFYFTVSGKGLIPSAVYDLALTGTAGGITINAPVGTMTADATGEAQAQRFDVPQVPDHTSWTLVATPRGGGFAPTVQLRSGYSVCVLPTTEHADRSFNVSWAGAGWKPGAQVSLTIDAGATITDTLTVRADGSFGPHTVTAQCTVGVTPQYQIAGATIDEPAVTVKPQDSLPCT